VRGSRQATPPATPLLHPWSGPQTALASAWDDSGARGKRTGGEPPQRDWGSGPGILEWHPEQAVGQFVVFAKLAQEGRRTKPPSVAPGAGVEADVLLAD
jgi:hypothetical protein